MTSFTRFDPAANLTRQSTSQQLAVVLTYCIATRWKIEGIKAIRTVTGLGLIEAKTLFERIDETVEDSAVYALLGAVTQATETELSNFTVEVIASLKRTVECQRDKIASLKQELALVREGE